LKLLVIGSNSDYAIERHYVKHFSDFKEITSIDFFSARQLFLDYYEKSLLNKLIYRIGFSNVLKEINESLVRQVSFFNPDIILVFKGMEIFPKTLRQFKAKGIKLVNYNPDNPFLFTGRGSGNRNITKSIGIYHAFVSYDRDICRTMESKHNVKSYCIPFGYEPKVGTEKWVEDEIQRVCFIGNGDNLRLDFLNRLAQKGLKIDLHGLHWKATKLHSNIKLFPPVYGDEFISHIRKYRVQLNLMRIHNSESHNMRSIEIPGYGAIQLAPFTPDHIEFFKRDEEIFVYKTLEECYEKATMILKLSKEEANRHKSLGYYACFNNGYSYRNRASQMTKVLMEIQSSLEHSFDNN
jgi:spore maturation protein CgeB